MSFKMLYLIGPDGLVNLSFENFQKMVWMTMVHIILSHDVFWKFAYPQKKQDMQILQVYPQTPS